ADGVVNEFGEVYDGSKKSTDPKAGHPGLYIVDGSVIPGALAANPTLTISAQALKAVERAVAPLPSLGWHSAWQFLAMDPGYNDRDPVNPTAPGLQPSEIQMASR